MSKEYSYPRIPEDEYKKLLWQFRSAIEEGLNANFDTLGLGALIPGCVNWIVKMTEEFSMRTRGKEQPLILPRDVQLKIDDYRKQKNEIEAGRYNADD